METGLSFPEAWDETRRQIVFTTHTPVQAGNEEHSAARPAPHGRVPPALGRRDAADRRRSVQHDGGGPAARAARERGVQAARRDGAARCGRTSTARRRSCSITNGVHAPTWQARRDPRRRRRSARGCGPRTPRSSAICSSSSERQRRHARPEALVIGFARRAAALQARRPHAARPGPARGAAAPQPIVLLFAGKAHPGRPRRQGDASRRIVAAQDASRAASLFLENYDMALARAARRAAATCGSTIPIRPLEASGTSGMKAAMNGVLNLQHPRRLVAGRLRARRQRLGDRRRRGRRRRSAISTRCTTLLEREVLPAWADRGALDPR